MNSKIYLVPVIIFGMFLSIILGLQSQWGNTAVISSVIVLFLSALVLGYVLNDIFQKYNEGKMLQHKYHEEYIKSFDSIKSENSKVITVLDENIKEYLEENNSCINNLLDVLNLLNNVVQEINDGIILLNKKMDNEFTKIKNIDRTLEDIQDDINFDEEIIVLQNIQQEIIKLNGKIDNEYTKIKSIDRTIDDMYEEIEDMNIDDFTTFVKESKKFVDELDNRLREERKQNIELIKQALIQYQNICDNFIRQSMGLNNEDIKLLKKISGELK